MQSEARSQLALALSCADGDRTILSHRYMAYPLSVSPVFRLDERDSRRAYLYRMNTSPGLLANDALRMTLDLGAGSQLYLADQAATKVHSMPAVSSRAVVDYQIRIGERAALEFLPEPIILFADAALKQTTEVALHSSATFCWGEIILPGRLASGEAYQFRECFSRVSVRSPSGALWFTDAMKLEGQENRFRESKLFAEGRVIGTLLLALPEGAEHNLVALGRKVDALATDSLSIASSTLPQKRGLFIRAVSQTTREMQAAFKAAASAVRSLRGEAALPYSV